ncbi:hypothetical protein CHU98_g5484 [Xylaria longipes]|nr:hypothetical protein CHU98_g5484 [Xylaria longipes]
MSLRYSLRKRSAEYSDGRATKTAKIDDAESDDIHLDYGIDQGHIFSMICSTSCFSSEGKMNAAANADYNGCTAY